DGSVPPHLLERLRQLEVPPPASTPASRRRTQAPRSGGNSRPSAGDPELDLYTAFQQLLLEDDD
ncbi:hypothetical protein KBZ04_12725, partial [Cyanobium sp. N5-Cardenillas]|nr:hypothetical protein [Cyanobium sp. N5-Cardenillas]